MASTNAFSSFRIASTNFSDAVVKLLKKPAKYADWKRAGSTDRGPHYLRAQEAVDEAWKKSFELGVVSIQLSHEIIAFFSEQPDKTDVETIQLRYHSVAMAIEATRAKGAEVQPAVNAAWQARRSLVLSGENMGHYGIVNESMNAIDEYFGPIEDGKVPSFESRATELAQFWSSLKPTEIEFTASSISDNVALNQRHIVRVCMYGLPLKPRYGSVTSATLDSPLIDRILGDWLLGREPYLRTLARYSIQQNLWKSDSLTKLFSKDIINSLSYLQSHNFSDLNEKASSSLTELLRLFAKTFASLLSAFASTWAIEQHVHRINTLDIFPLGRDSFATLQSIPGHLERAHGAANDANVHVDTIIHMLNQLLQSRTFLGCNTSTDVNDDPKCVECELADLLAYSKEVLLYNIGLFSWKQTFSEQPSDEEGDNVLINDFRNIVISDRPYAPSLYPQHFVDPGPQLSTISQIPPSSQIEPVFDLESPELFWSQVLAISTTLQKHLPLEEMESRVQHRYSQAPPRPLHRWRPCSCKEQGKFAADSKKAKDLAKAAASPSGLFSRKAPNPPSSTQGASFAQKKGGTSSLQGDWTF